MPGSTRARDTSLVAALGLGVLCGWLRRQAVGQAHAAVVPVAEGETYGLQRQEQALRVLAEDKHNEAACLMDGAWTGHPDQNEIAVNQFPYPNQVQARRKDADVHKDLRPSPQGVGKRTLDGTRAAVRTVIRYRNGVLNGKGASLLDGYMEDLATDRIYRLMIAQRMKHGTTAPDDSGKMIEHTPEQVSQLFDEELDRILRERASMKDVGSDETFREARRISEQMIVNEQFDPV